MAFFPELTGEHLAFIAAQRMFFTATAAAGARINLSPKGMDTFRCLGPRAVAYLDATGSGNETAAHLQQDGRLTLMFCSFDEKPLILRLYGTGTVHKKNSAGWRELRPLFPALPGERQIISLAVESVQASCGFAVPFYEFAGERSQLRDWSAKKGEEGIREYQMKKNMTSIDGAAIDL